MMLMSAHSGRLGGRDVAPGRAAVARDVHQPIVGAGPEDAALVRRLGEGEDRAVVLGAGIVLGDRAAGRAELAGIVARQVGADDLPAGALVGRAEDVVGRDIQHVGVVRRDSRIGKVHWKRYFRSRRRRPMPTYSGQTVMLRSLAGAMVVAQSGGRCPRRCRSPRRRRCSGRRAGRRCSRSRRRPARTTRSR